MSKPEGDLSVTALYTSQVWRWAGFESAELMDLPEARAVFRITNFVLGVARFFRRFPILRCSLAQRHHIIDRLVQEAGSEQVLEVAAGLSQRGLVVSRDAAVDYVELDLPHMVQRKRDLLARSEAGRTLAQRSNLRLVAGDAAETDLATLVDPGKSLTVVAEGLLTYLDAEQQRSFWRRVAELLRGREAGRLIFDLIPGADEPRPGIMGRILEALMKPFTGGRSFEVDQRTRDDILADLAACGFGEARWVEPSSAPENWELPFLMRSTQVLVFEARPPNS